MKGAKGSEPRILKLSEYRRRSRRRLLQIGSAAFVAVFSLGMLTTAGRPLVSRALDPVALHIPQARAEGRFDCTVQRVTDGDTFRCTSGVKVRLSSIDTPEMPGSCRPGRKCAPGDPYAAKAALSALISGRTLQCEAMGKTYDRIAAWCSADGQDLSCAMLRRGHAVRLAQHDSGRRLCS
jgi:endonuclease YncB( thermonuclease family)